MSGGGERLPVPIPTNNEGHLKDCPAFTFGELGPSSQGIVVLQEWWGVNQHIKEKSADLAKRGNFAALLPDLYRGKVATNREEASHYYADLNWRGAVEDVRACVTYLKSQGCKKVGVLGFCMGGALSLASAAMLPGVVDAAASFYGICNEQLCDVAKTSCPLQLHFGRRDEVVGFSSPADVDKLIERLDLGGVTYELNWYDAGHGFTNPTNPNYQPEAASQALSRTISFMHAKLQH